MSTKLPAELGHYESVQFPISRGEYDPYFCDGEGKWFEVNELGRTRIKSPQRLGPFRRLVPADD